MFGSISSKFGFWDAGAWIVMFLLAGSYVLALRCMGRSDYKKGTAQDEIYYSGNAVPETDAMTVPATAAYWGFREALKGYYSRLTAMHRGIATDYVGYFMLTAAALLVCFLVA